MRDRRQRVHEEQERKLGHVEGAQEYEKLLEDDYMVWTESVIREYAIDSDKRLPNKQQKEWMAAQAYVHIKQKTEVSGRKLSDFIADFALSMCVVRPRLVFRT